MKVLHAFMRSVVILIAVAIVGLVVWRMRTPPPAIVSSQASTPTVPAPGPSFGAVADFQFVNQEGKTVGLKDLIGQAWVADFIFTRCAGPCPTISRQMAQIAKEFSSEKGLRFVTFTVDPAHDTPAVLAAYMKNYEIPATQWTLLTGKPEEVQALIKKSFHLAVESGPEQGTQPQIIHSLNFVVVDRAGLIQGYYDSSDAQTQEELKKKLRELLVASSS